MWLRTIVLEYEDWNCLSDKFSYSGWLISVCQEIDSPKKVYGSCEIESYCTGGNGQKKIL